MKQKESGSLLLTAVLLVLISGCSGGPERFAVPEFDPDSIAEAAVNELDKDGDESLSPSELENSPGLEASIQVFDSNRDGNISKDELRVVFEQWLEERTGLISIRCEVRYRGQPLRGAQVHMIPEAFLGNVVPEAMGETDAMGMTQISCDSAHLPDAVSSMKAIKPGVYRIEVTHPSISIPSKYNTETTLGRSVSLRNSHTLSLHL